jgi:Leucine-rich repeat (LRR) protein
MSYNLLNSLPQNIANRKRKREDDDEENLICQLENSKVKINRADYSAVKEVIDIMQKLVYGNPRRCVNRSKFSQLKTTKTIIQGISDEEHGYRITKLNLSNYPEVKLPESIFGLDALESLNLSYARNLDTIPPEIERLKNMKMLDLSHAEKIQLLPKEIGNLSNLQKLTIIKRSKITLPKEISNLKCLVELDLWFLDLKNDIIQISEGFENLKELKIAVSSQWHHSSGLQKFIANLNSLERLDIRFIHRAWEFPDMFQNLNNLQELVLHRLEVTALPNSIGSLVNLVTLELDGCNRLQSLPENFDNLVNLKYLELSETKIQELPVTVSALKQLVKLDLSYSSVRIFPDNFVDLINLQELILRGCPISDLPHGFDKLDQLLKLDLSFTRGWINAPTSLHKLTNLKELNIQGLCIQMDLSIPFCVVPPTTLLKLKLSRITDISFFPESLQEIDLVGSSNKDFCESEISLKSLKSLRISHVVDFDSDPYDENYHDMYSEEIDDSSSFDLFCSRLLPRCPNLSKVDFSYNEISDISLESLNALANSKVRSIDLGGNLLTNSPEPTKPNFLSLVKECKLLGYANYHCPPEVQYLMACNRAERKIFLGQPIQNSIWPTILESPCVVFKRETDSVNDYPSYISEHDALFEILRRRLANDIQSWWPTRSSQSK